MKTISDTLRAALIKRGMSVRQMSISTGINRETIARFLRGENMTIHNADKLARLVDMELKPVQGRKQQAKGEQ